jgi:hypothetical protein
MSGNRNPGYLNLSEPDEASDAEFVVGINVGLAILEGGERQ